MIRLYFIIPIVFLIFTIGDAIAEAKVKRKPVIPWSWHLKNIPSQIKSFFRGYHLYTWIRRYSSNGLLAVIWFYMVSINISTICLFFWIVFFLWIIWELIYLFVTKRIKIKKTCK